MKKRNVSIYAGGGGPAEPTAERHPQSDPGEKLTIAIEQSVLADAVKSNVKDGAPAPVRASETGRARNWTMPPLRLERECKEHSAEQNDLLSFCERRNSATIDNRCVEFDRRESTESTVIIGLRALGRRIAFTMAEILLSLTIIGVVAAITLPSLTGNINERTWNTQRKALYARMSQAIALMPALNGYGTLTEDESGNVIEDTAAETFVTNGLSKVLKINNICDSEHLEDCGITSKMIDMNGSTISPLPTTLYDMNSKFAINADLWGEEVSILNTNSAAFETANGESILVFYNPYCRSDLANQGESARRSSMNCMCANFVYDLNGTKGPNTVGKDINFISVLYPSDSEVVSISPVGYANPSTGTQIESNKFCEATYAGTRAPNYDEAAALFYNRYLIGNIERGVGAIWTNKAYSATNGWALNIDDGSRTQWNSRTGKSFNIYCIRRVN